MTAIEKFTFALSFDDADNVIRSAGDEEEYYELGKKKKKKKKDEPPPPPPAVYTEEQGAQMVADAEKKGREAGFAEGHKQGFEEAHQQIMESLEKAVGDVESVIAEKLDQIDEQQKRANAKINEDAIHVALGVIRKLAPAWSKQYQLTEIEDIIRQCLANLFEAPKVMIKVHPDLENEVRAAAQRIAESRGFSGKVIVIGEADVEIGDCTVSWGDGTAVRDSTRVWSEINGIIDNAMALHAEEHDLPPSDMGDPEVQDTRLPAEEPVEEQSAAPQETSEQNNTEAPEQHEMPSDAVVPDAAPSVDMPTPEMPTEPSPPHGSEAGNTPPNTADAPANYQKTVPEHSDGQEVDGAATRNMQTSQEPAPSGPAAPMENPAEMAEGAQDISSPAPEPAPEPAVTGTAAEDQNPDEAANVAPATEDQTVAPANTGAQEQEQVKPTDADEMAAAKQPTKDAGDENG